MKSRIEFNMHSNYSKMNGIKTPKEIIDRAIELGMDTIAITDIGSVKGLPSAYDYIKMHSKKIKLILGMEAFYAQGRIYCEVKNEDNFSRIIILAKNEIGRKNLYKLISAYYKDGYAKLTTREGLLLGTNGLNSSIIHCLVVGKSNQEVKDSINEYDFILVNPLNYHEHVKQIVSYAKETETLVIASNSPYYFSDNESIAREVLRFADIKDTEMAEDLTLCSTEDMLNTFDYLGNNTEDVVINNGYKLAKMVEDNVPPVPSGMFYPESTGKFDEIKERTFKKATEIYGKSLPEPVKMRLNKELRFVSENDYSINFWIAMRVADDCKAKGYPVTSRAATGSSLMAYLLGLTHVNPLKPHYRCEDCNHIEFVEGFESGFDLPAKKCPNCGKDLLRDGHNIPYETMFGFDGNKEPDIDLNLSEEYQFQNMDFIMNLLGLGKGIRGGVASTLPKKTAQLLIEDYSDKTQADFSREEKESAAELCEGAFRKTSVNQGKFIYIPDGYEIEDFTPIEYIKDDYFGKVPVTHFSCREALYALFQCDFLGLDTVQMLKLLKEKTGVEQNENDIEDNAKLLKAVKKGNIESIPEMCTEYVRKMIEHTKPVKFSDCVALSGLAHGTGVYEGNAKDLFAEGFCDFSYVIAFREDVLLYLDKKRKEYTEKTGKEAPLSYLDCYKISEIVRKGRAKRDLHEYENALKEIGIPDWYIYSAKKIKYLLPKAHSVEYMITAFKLLWYKLNYPNEFQDADYEVNGIIPTGFKKLDEILKGGFRKGDLCLIGARPGVGKTTFAIQLADYIADGDKKVVFFSLESPKNRIEEILYKQGTAAPLMEIDDTSVIDADYIRNKLVETEADVAVIDYFWLLHFSEKIISSKEEASYVAYKLRKTAEELNVAVIVTMQLSIEYGKKINELKHHCALEGFNFSDQDANTIIFLNRYDYYADEDFGSNAFQIIAAKNAYGNIGTIDATFDSEKRLFKEV